MVYIIKWDNLNQDEQALVLSMQGVINRAEKKVFVDTEIYMEYLDENLEKKVVSLWEILEECKHNIKGYVKYTLSDSDVGINMAATVSAGVDVLGVPKSLEEKVKETGLNCLYDLDDIKGSSAERQKVVFDGVYEMLNKDGLVHQVVSKNSFLIKLRDFGISKRWACIYTSENAEDREFRKYVLEKLDKNIAVYGWTDDEIAFIRDISSYGDYAIPMDWAMNNSYLSGTDEYIKQNYKKIPVKKDKHYVALVVSDGDNIQWLERDFSTTGLYGQRLNSKENYKMTWTISPSLVKLCPDALRRIYRLSKNDYFISGVSGVGYANPCEYPEEYLKGFCEITAEIIKQSEIKEICILDNKRHTKNKEFFESILYNYAKYDSIDGGILEIDPDRYSSGKGKMFFSNEKPFVSVRYSLWPKDSDANNITKKWLDSYVKKINSMPVCPTKTKGYTVVNIHPWTMTMDDVDYVVKNLSDKIELVYVDELLELIKENVVKK